ncbi:DUF1766-domain-containing protein [Ophiobolus disseminans]|uniref:DUF1766-domain-containing protein n=1 Tax=Ophiobolus disseminans TaxID=1469910 RepID=A0A6A7AHQ3_9PLEO|nr:DUF1766-domain-containing protein [Ophiobolus disseminans]
MASHSITDKKEVLQTLSEYKASTQKTHLCDKIPHHGLSSSRTSTIVDNCFDQPAKGILDLTGHGPYDVTEQHSTTETILESLYHRNPGSPALSPASSSSTVASPGDASNFWDSPKTPHYHRGGKKSSIEALTPETPPTTLSVVSRQQVVFTPPSLLSKRITIFGDIEARITRSKAQDISSAGEVDEFTPQKLVRGWTAKFLEIAAEHATAAQEYSLQPTFNFTNSPNSRAYVGSARNKLRCDVKEESTDIPVKVQKSVEELKKTAISHKEPLCAETNSLLEHIIPWSIHARLKESSLCCVASLIKNPHQRCTYAAKGSLDRVEQVFRNLSRSNVEHDYAAILKHVEDLMHAAQCGRHRNSADTRLDKLRAQAPDLADLSSNKRSSISVWVDAISNPSAPQQHDTQSDDKPVSTKSSSSKTTRSPSPNVRLSYSLTFTPYQPKSQARTSIQKALLSIITQPLKPTDKKHGFIYIFWDVEHFGMVKIGHTKDLQARLKQWNTQCKRTHNYHGELPEVPHVSRIERLIHVELKDRRKQRLCEGCGVMHMEWFEAREEHAVRVFHKWQTWIEKRPYALDQNTGEWRVRDEMMAELVRVCEPVEEVVEVRQQGLRRRDCGMGGKEKGKGKGKKKRGGVRGAM